MRWLDPAELSLLTPLEQAQTRKSECEQLIAHIDNDTDPDLPAGDELRRQLRNSCEAMIRMYDKQIVMFTPKEVAAEDLV